MAIRPRSPLSAAKPSTAQPAARPADGLLLGPILGVESVPGQALRYTCCLVWGGAAPASFQWKVGGTQVAFTLTSPVQAGGFYRAEWSGAVPETTVAYQILADNRPVVSPDGNNAWNFTTAPAKAEGFRFVYASCNGFSAAKLLAQNPDPYGMWTRLDTAHRETPHHLLAMGGDQIYADSVWEQPWMKAFAHLGRADSVTAPVTPEQDTRADGFYEDLYLQQWNRPEVARVLASIPSVMMWDDHDIFDGWGSFSPEQQNSPVFQRLYLAARRAFRLFQLRGRLSGEFLINSSVTHDFALTVADTTFLALDHRGVRTQEVIIGAPQWTALAEWLKTFDGQRLFVMTGVPVVYRSFKAVEAYLDFTPWQEELEDDLHDHWSARRHQRERVRFIYQFLRRQEELKAAEQKTQWVFLSGDVHVGGVGVVWEEVRDVGLYQIISSGIAHPPPTALQWKAIQLTSSDAPEVLGDGDLKAELLVATGAADNYLRTRNFVLAEVGNDDRLWFAWQCEDGQKPIFSI